MAEDADIFSNLLAKWAGVYALASCSYVGLKTPQGPNILCGRVQFETSSRINEEQPFKHETEHIIAERFVMKIEAADVSEVIAKARQGRIGTLSGEIALAPDGERFSTYLPSGHDRFESELSIRGVSRHTLLGKAGYPRNLDGELRSADVPFDSLDELLANLGLPVSTQLGDYTRLEVSALSPAGISTDSTIGGGEAVINCAISKSLDFGKLKLGYRFFQKGKPIARGGVTGKAFQWSEKASQMIGSYRVKLDDAPLLRAYLSYDGVLLEVRLITDPTKQLNQRHAVHNALDADLKILREILGLDRDKSGSFEIAVSTLFSLLGYSPTIYGQAPKLLDGPDIIAFTPNAHVAVIECTTGPIAQNDKLGKLVQRTVMIRNKLADAIYGSAQVQPVIVTSRSRKEAAAGLEAAGKHDIAVLCKEELEELLARASLPPDPDSLFQDLKHFIPLSSATDPLLGSVLRAPGHGNFSESQKPV